MNRYRDNLCFFRSLSHCLIGNHNQNSVNYYFEMYCRKKNITISAQSFKGLPYSDIELAKKLFEVNIQLFHLTKKCAVCWHHSLQSYEKTLNLM